MGQGSSTCQGWAWGTRPTAGRETGRTVALGQQLGWRGHSFQGLALGSHCHFLVPSLPVCPIRSRGENQDSLASASSPAYCLLQAPRCLQRQRKTPWEVLPQPHTVGSCSPRPCRAGSGPKCFGAFALLLSRALFLQLSLHPSPRTDAACLPPSPLCHLCCPHHGDVAHTLALWFGL